MRTLGIDTATTGASVALVVEDRLVAQRSYPERNSPSQATRNHAEVLIPLVVAVLREAGLTTNDLDRIAVSIGPGSFTGVRIALSTAKGIAFGSAIPVIGVSTLMAYATAVVRCELVCPLLDARKQEAYMALFRSEAGKFHRLVADSVLPIAGVVQQLAQHSGDCVLIGAGANIYGPLIQEALGARITLAETPEDFTVAAAVARLAGANAGDFGSIETAELVPAYVRPPEAERKRRSDANLSN